MLRLELLPQSSLPYPKDYPMQKRRNFLKKLTAMSTIMIVGSKLRAASKTMPPAPIATQQYPWFTFFRREGKDWNKDLSDSLSQVRRAGFKGFEGGAGTVDDLDPY